MIIGTGANARPAQVDLAVLVGVTLETGEQQMVAGRETETETGTGLIVLVEAQVQLDGRAPRISSSKRSAWYSNK